MTPNSDRTASTDDREDGQDGQRKPNSNPLHTQLGEGEEGGLSSQPCAETGTHIPSSLVNQRLLEALRQLTGFAMERECWHESTHRGGAIWTICDDCGAKWADDEGGKPDYIQPPEITEASAAIKAALGDGERAASATQRLLDAAKGLSFGAYPAHGSGFVCIVQGDLDAFREAIAEVDQRLAAGSEPSAAWRPIETAPRGPEPFLVWAGTVDLVWWFKGYAYPCDGDRDPITDGTHWMPLPEGPK